jgi:O-antigen/teichoic acid export membrane protein
MSTVSDNNKRVAKNTLIMYGRMLLVTFITLFTVRIALKTLGIEDYGIYNVVAGVVLFVSFISNSMQLATLRFYSFAIGEQDKDKQNAVFNLSLLIYLLIVVAVIVLAETIGLWFLYNEMIIPEDRMFAAFWIYQFAILSFIITMLSTPFSSMIIAHEDMGMYAILSLTDCILKLMILFPILVIPYDRLFIYGLLMFVVVLIKESIGVVYCKRKYTACFFRFRWDKNLLQSIFSYSGWTLFGTLAGVAYNQGSNILINLFFGPIANAARVVAYQIGSATTMLSNNCFTVLRPPLIKSYAEKNHAYMMKMFYTGSKLSYILVFVFFLPLMLEMEFILRLWLDEVNTSMIVFSRLSLMSSLILSMHNPITTIIEATGCVKKYFIIVESITILILPLSYLFFKWDYAAESTFYIAIVAFTIAHFLRIIILKSQIVFSIRKYLKEFVFPVITISIVSLALSLLLRSVLTVGFIRHLTVMAFSMVIVSACSYYWGLNGDERIMLKLLLKHKTD